METKRHLTDFEKKIIWETIYHEINPDDRDPWEVICSGPYFGNIEKYLLTMAKWHNINLHKNKASKSL